ncbi:MAG: 4-alpha-glucanotransferase [Burkholderiales bacterium]|nr:4-alpha-glucanotransferase [Burkholderiales bacterium]
MDETLARLAADCGIEPGYWDGLGQRRDLSEDGARAIVAALGYPGPPAEELQRRASRTRVRGQPCAPSACHIAEDLQQGRRVWGLAVQLYALRSERNWGSGDFTDLAALARVAAAAGAQAIGLNPLHARTLSRPDDASPYAPSSRLFIDPLALDVEAVAGYGGDATLRAGSPEFQARLAAQRALPRVDHAAVCALKLEILGLAYTHWKANTGTAGQAALAQFSAQTGEQALQQFCDFEAARLGTTSPAGRVGAESGFHAFLQWQCDLQLGAAAATARAAGMRIGLYRDLAVGAAADGAEVAAHPHLFADGMHVGAPPDLLNREGQDWGLPPWIPERLADASYQPFRDLLRANMRHAGALRIDHVMALTRLFWIPRGARGSAGAYVRYDFDAMAACVAEESRRRACMVIGEDLGSVPDGLRDALSQRGLLSYRVLLFERHWDGDGSFKQPWEYPRQALATLATHDMPTVADFWDGGDIARQESLGLLPPGTTSATAHERRAAERAGLAALCRALDLPAPGEDGAQASDSLHAVLARTESMLAMVQLDDILGETEPVNIPGTWREYPNWTRKQGRAIEALAADPRFERVASLMRAAGRA